MSAEFLKLKMPPLIIDSFTRKLREVANIRQHGTRHPRFSLLPECRRHSSSQLHRQQNQSVVDRRSAGAKQKWTAGLKTCADQVLVEQERHRAGEFAEPVSGRSKEINRAVAIGEAKAHKGPRRRWSRPICALVISIAKKYTNRGLQFPI